MNKTKLEVIRINEDVISTSGENLCNIHPDKQHAFVYSVASEPYTSEVFEPYKTTVWKENVLGSTNFYNTPTAHTWYYYDGAKFVECNGDHSGYQHNPH